MALITTVRHPLGGADNVALLEMLVGEAFSWTGVCKSIDEEGNELIIDITDWNISCHIEAYTGVVLGTSVSDLLKRENEPPIALTVVKTLPVRGQFRIDIPADLVDDDIAPLAPPTTPVPVMIGWVAYESDDEPPRIRQHRFLLVYRRGQPSVSN